MILWLSLRIIFQISFFIFSKLKLVGKIQIGSREVWTRSDWKSLDLADEAGSADKQDLSGTQMTKEQKTGIAVSLQPRLNRTRLRIFSKVHSKLQIAARPEDQGEMPVAFGNTYSRRRSTARYHSPSSRARTHQAAREICTNKFRSSDNKYQTTIFSI